MRHLRGRRLFACGLVALLTHGHPDAQSPPVSTQLDRYLRGDHEAVIAEIAARNDFGDLLDGLKRDGRGWIEAAPAPERARRRLAAATLALEAARAAEDADWKQVMAVRLGGQQGSEAAETGAVADARRAPGMPAPSYNAPDALYWKPPPLILEWGCALMRSGGAPTAVERIWHLASVAVAQRRGDYEFLIGSPWSERGNPDDEIEHLAHLIKRFPSEPRFVLAQAIAIEWRSWSPALPRTAARPTTELRRALEALVKDEAIGAEATLRLGVQRIRSADPRGAIVLLQRVEEMTRDRYLIYLARFSRGQAHDRLSQGNEAEQAYRDALATIPHAMSATMALAARLFNADRRAESSALVEASLAARPQPVDPWRAYLTADDRFWPELITRLRTELRK